ncbi:sporulation protein [Ramlibacter humi]|uniref:Sporulation protein n=1 Tax=Ramlibacter humi TaxID=2530451 RepID=A0A4Z0BVS6_9BURK|nr:sporulation protein [Ramlibacter humi]
MNKQRGNILVGIVIGVVLGLGAALAVAVYVTKVPIPFVTKNPARTPDQDAAESRKNKDWDPNAPLYGKNPARPLPPAPAASAASGAASAPVAATPDRPASAPRAPAASADPLGDLAAARSATPGADPFFYFVQVGAFRTPEDAEAQRAKLSLMGVEAKVTEREQSGRQVFRVRVGPFEKKDEAEKNKEKLESVGLETALVRVQR